MSTPVTIAATVDLNLPFVCPDISPTSMMITKAGLTMGGVIYPLTDPNASSVAEISTSIFTSDDGLNEIDIRQNDTGEVEVSYMKFKEKIDEYIGDSDKLKVFEKASFSIKNPPPYFFSKNKVCRNL